MLEMVEVTSEQGELLTLALAEVATGIIVKRIDGLDPVKATLVASKHAGRAGAQFHASQREPRNILMRLDLDSRFGGGSIREIRQTVYSVFAEESEITMKFHMSDGFVVHAKGRVESIESPMFEKEPFAAISIMCYDPDLIDPDPVVNSGEAYPAGLQLYTIDYDGSSPTGINILLEMNATGSGTGFEVTHIDPAGNTSVLVFDADLSPSDQVEINTVPGEKRALRITAGVPSSILYGVSPQSKWIQLKKGTNQLGIQVTGNTQQSFYTYSYYNRYGGL